MTKNEHQQRSRSGATTGPRRGRIDGEATERDEVRYASLHIRHFAAVIVLMMETEPRRIR